ncbi:MAG: hypothetical protein JXR96_13890 [Deltaproteobacteria bacterium]|nr:hypothetical protein [Deltaproteobacteria bacterium]
MSEQADTDGAADEDRPLEPLGDLTGAWQLFVDDRLILERVGITRRYHAFEKYAGNPLIVADEPWEGKMVYVFGSVLPEEDGTGFRMWYNDYPNMTQSGDERYRTLYATSQDGMQWLKPDLGIRSWQGSTANNILFPRAEGSCLASVIHTPWDPDPQRRYKVLNYVQDSKSYFAAWSPDGIHMSDVPGNPVLSLGIDVGQFTWDPHTQRYLGYVKLRQEVDGKERRCVALTTTTDITSWPDPEIILTPDGFDDRWANPNQCTHLYGMSAFPYESMYLGFLWIFRATDEDDCNHEGPVFVELVSSRDGVAWKREEGDRPPLVDLGPPGAWDDSQVYTARKPLLVGDELWLYYGGCDEEHGVNLEEKDCSIGLAKLRKDGFVSLDAGESPAQITTPTLSQTGGSLHVNYSATGGHLEVELLDGDGQVIPQYDRVACDPLTGDEVDRIVAWGGRTALPAGPLRLRFIMQNASLYSFMAGKDLALP